MESITRLVLSTLPKTQALTYGVVAAASPLTVYVAGESVARSVNKLASYSPVIGDRVLIAVVNNQPPVDLVVIGKIG